MQEKPEKGNRNILFTLAEAKKLFIPRQAESHKGTYGHGLLVAGTYGMAGAAVLAARSCLHSGTGLLTVSSPECNRIVLQTAVPEAMMRPNGETLFTESIHLPPRCTTLAVGPGIGTDKKTEKALFALLRSACEANIPTIVDADALNILSLSDCWWQALPSRTIITPHPGEFSRLLRPSPHMSSPQERLPLAQDMARIANVCVVLKGHETVVAMPDGRSSVNTSGNAGMATGGSGDALTGVLLALCAQGYDMFDAARLGVFAHGLAGDYASSQLGPFLAAMDIVRFLPEAWKQISLP